MLLDFWQVEGRCLNLSLIRNHRYFNHSTQFAIDLDGNLNRSKKPSANQGRRVCSVVPPCLLLPTEHILQDKSRFGSRYRAKPATGYPICIQQTSVFGSTFTSGVCHLMAQQASSTNSSAPGAPCWALTSLSRLAAGWFTTPALTIFLIINKIKIGRPLY